MSSLGSLTGLNASGINFSGLASGLDSNKIIQALLAIQQGRIAALQANQAKVVAQQGAFQTVQAKLTDFQAQASKLAQALNSPFDAKTISSSNTALATAAASASAAPGVYTFTVNSLAQAQQISSQGFSGPTSAITQGTLRIQVGTGAATTVTIDNTNNTLQGLANAINNSSSDVTASIVNAGGATNPYKLVLTSKKTGAANTITLTNNLAADNGGAVKPLLTTTVQAAADAQITVGSGPGALTVNNATNTLDGVFGGVTINLVSADPTKTVTLSVANDTDNAKKSVHDFVDSFNKLIDYLNAANSFDPKTNQVGLLLGQQIPNNVQSDLSRTLGDVVGGVNAKANRLSTLGITFDNKGKLLVDDTKLTNALSGQTAGVGPGDVRRLFALDVQSSNAGIQFINASDKTIASANPYQVVVTRAATGGSFLGSNALGGSIVINGTNNTFTFNVDGKVSNTITLTQGTYSAATLAQEVQAEINKDSQIGNNQVAVSVGAGNKLNFTSQSFGTSSQVKIIGGTALTALGLSGTESGIGQNVAGYFLVNGVQEAATGTGQFLQGNSSNANTADLRLRVTLTPAQVGTQTQANLTVSRGVASKVNLVLNKYLDPLTGQLKTENTSLQSRVDDIQKQIDFQTKLLQNQQDALVKQFAALEATISQLKTSGDFLNTQLLNFTKTGK